jgi:hypothetical protein
MERLPTREEIVARNQQIENGLEILARGYGRIDESNSEDLLGLPHSGEGIMQDLVNFFEVDQTQPLHENSIWNAVHRLTRRGIVEYGVRGARSDYDKSKVLTFVSIVED